MKTHQFFVGLALAAAMVATAFQSEAAVVYSNGPIAGNIGADRIRGGYPNAYYVSDSFTLSTSATLTGPAPEF